MQSKMLFQFSVSPGNAVYELGFYLPSLLCFLSMDFHHRICALCQAESNFVLALCYSFKFILSLALKKVQQAT
jgi:hypothetical protein